jgi:hypothetical protein
MLSEKSRVKAVAAKISAARELARRLAEEKQAAVAAARADVDSDKLKRSTEQAAAAAAAQVRHTQWQSSCGTAASLRGQYPLVHVCSRLLC